MRKRIFRKIKASPECFKIGIPSINSSSLSPYYPAGIGENEASFNLTSFETSARLLRDRYCRTRAVCIAKCKFHVTRVLRILLCVLTSSCALWLFHRNSLSIWQMAEARIILSNFAEDHWLPSRAASSTPGRRTWTVSLTLDIFRFWTDRDRVAHHAVTLFQHFKKSAWFTIVTR